MSQRTYQQFIFKDYHFNERSKELQLTYAIDEAFKFTETYTFDFEYVPYNTSALERAIENLFFMAGVSYYKTFIPPEIIIQKGALDEQTAAFFSKTYQRGLGEFWYVNQLAPTTPVTFPVNATISQSRATSADGALVGIGGGKDSLVSVELLRNSGTPLTTWSLNHKPQLTPLVERINLPHLWVERALDPQLQQLNQHGALNGHVPLSAILACAGTVAAVLSGNRDVMVSNEQSANEATLVYQGVEINHQYSKSQEFEQDYQALLDRHFGDTLRYYSLLRPFSELRITEMFTNTAFRSYKDVFSSCNRTYTLTSDRMSWCGTCPKCAFTFLALTPFLPREEIETVFGGKNLLLDPALESIYQQLLGINADKPLECVGEIRESRAAMAIAQQQYPELSRFHFDLPSDYDYRAFHPSSMPEEVLRLLVARTQAAID